MKARRITTGEVGVEALKPAPADLFRKWPVSSRVNSSKAPSDDSNLIDANRCRQESRPEQFQVQRSRKLILRTVSLMPKRLRADHKRCVPSLDEIRAKDIRYAAPGGALKPLC